MKIIPTKIQFDNWSMPSKVTYFAFIIGIIALISTIIFFVEQWRVSATRDGQHISHAILNKIDQKVDEALGDEYSRDEIIKKNQPATEKRIRRSTRAIK